MALILKSAGLKTVPKNSAEISDLGILIDKVGEQSLQATKDMLQIKKLMDGLKAYKADLKKLNEMVDVIAQYGDDVEFTEQGVEYQVEAGAREFTRSIVDLQGIRKKLTDKVFFEVAKVTLTDIDRYIAKSEQEKLNLVKTERTTRKITVSKLTRK